MTIEITSRHFTASEHLQELVKSKVQKIEKYSPSLIVNCSVVLIQDNGNESVEIKTHIKNHEIFAQDTTEVFEKSLTNTVNKVVSQIKKYHDKATGKVKTHN